MSDGTKEKQSNILLFVADDLGWKDTGVYGSGYFETPDAYCSLEA